MKKLKYILTILIVLFLFTIIKNIIGIDNDFNNPKVEINEEITFQNENEKEKKLDINTVDFEEMVNAGISSKIGYSIIEYRGFVGYIDNLENLTRIKGINKNTLDKLKKIVYIDEMNKKEYMKHNINYLDDTGLFLLGF
ncbi:helix-hairpin-helix domain-containing protein [Streptobacillus notomytis]|uniref:helix-hairpin-helix domain-containing protein n=1 Tax=Streptobacillus notomytis TaxID=1712031 RepID=UPI000936C98A|nr:helix-hairpin-helix domain-containing protein [Streptobacillus notomytis]